MNGSPGATLSERREMDPLAQQELEAKVYFDFRERPVMSDVHSKVPRSGAETAEYTPYVIGHRDTLHRPVSKEESDHE